MVFGYSTNAFVKYPVLKAVEMIAGLGFRGVEIMCDRPHLYPDDFSKEELEGLRCSIQGKGLKVTNLNSFTLFAVGDTYLPSWIEESEERRSIRIGHTLRCLELASFLGCANISVPPGGPQGGLPRRQAMKLFHEGLEEVIPVAEKLGVRVLVEPEPGLLLEDSKGFLEFIQEVGSGAVGLNFDIGHFFCAGEDPGAAFEKLFPWIGHVHLEDIAPTRVHAHLIPGLGAIDFQAIFSTMVRLGYRGDMSLELYPYVDAPEEAGRRALVHLKPLFRDAGFPVEG